MYFTGMAMTHKRYPALLGAVLSLLVTTSAFAQVAPQTRSPGNIALMNGQ